MTKLTFISDSHCRHNEIPKEQLPGGDILVHTGDWTNRGSVVEAIEFLQWLEKQTQYTHRVFIAGNHDLIAEQNPSLFRSLIPSNCIYLEDNGIELCGLKFWGTPVTPYFCDWAFNRTTTELHKHFNYIPDDTNVILTHGGPKRIGLQKLLDGLDVGIEELSDFDLPELKVNAFGHIHHSYGYKEIGGTTFINSAICGESYRVENKPIHLEL
jgi:Icc-related predicted phosphoesterase